METFKKILVVSRSTKHCCKVLNMGISLAHKYNAHLYVMHVIHDPFNLDGWNLPVPSLEREYEKMVSDANEVLERMLHAEKEKGLPITVWVRDGRPDKEIIKAVKEEKIDLILMLAHEEGRLEHFLFGKTNDELIRALPASLILVKKPHGKDEKACTIGDTPKTSTYR
jgi:universal stress protein A